MYRISVYDNKGAGVPVILFKAVVHGWGKKISAPGSMTFSLPISDPDATTANLQKYRRVQLSRLRQDGSAVYDVVWTGYIEAAKENINTIDVICQSMLALFKKRYTDHDQTFSGQGSSVAFTLLTDANGDYDTGVVTGTGIPGIPFTADPGHNTILGGNRLVGEAIICSNTGGALPTGISSLTTYYIIGSVGPYGYQLSTSLGGGAITISDAGSGTNTYTLQRSQVASGRQDLLTTWTQIALANNAEFEIDDTYHFNFVTALGSDKSSTITLRYRRDGTPGSNVNLTGLGEDGQYMANRIIGTSSANSGMTSTQNDTASQAIYGVLTEIKQFNQAQDQATLDGMTISYLSQRAYPLTDYAAVPLQAAKNFDIVTGGRKVSGLQYGDINVGDLVFCDILTENQTIYEARRVAEIDVTTDEQNGEQILYTLSKTGVFLTSAWHEAGSINEIRRRISSIESLLS